jgi:hypothetical protein
MNRTLSIRVEKKYRSKYECEAKAQEILDSGLIDMDEAEIAQEIYAHARAYYWLLRFAKIPGFRFLLGRADPVDLADGGDKKFRRMVYRLVWKLT